MSEIQYKLADDIVSRTNQDGTVIVMKMDDANNFFKINGIAAEIWSGLSASKPLTEIENNVLENYEVSADQFKNDSNEFIDKLIQKKLISII